MTQVVWSPNLKASPTTTTGEGRGIVDEGSVRFCDKVPADKEDLPSLLVEF
jgi:hypothetical protein